LVYYPYRFDGRVEVVSVFSWGLAIDHQRLHGRPQSLLPRPD
jgi:hypothetical protein